MATPSLRRAILFGIPLCFFFSGAAGLIYQVAWSKSLGLVFGHTVYAIATVFAVFMFIRLLPARRYRPAPPARGAIPTIAPCSNTALDREPYSHDAHRALAELYRQRKLWPQARKHLEFIVCYRPDMDAEVYAALAEVDRAMGDPRAAVEALRKGRRVFPDDSRLRDLGPPE